jgi:hypothetical protein
MSKHSVRSCERIINAIQKGTGIHFTTSSGVLNCTLRIIPQFSVHLPVFSIVYSISCFWQVTHNMTLPPCIYCKFLTFYNSLNFIENCPHTSYYLVFVLVWCRLPGLYMFCLCDHRFLTKDVYLDWEGQN